MNTKKFNTTLQKLNDLFSALNRYPGEVSAIERDLLRNYLVKLYDLSAQAYDQKVGSIKKDKKSAKSKEEKTLKPFIEKLVKVVELKEEPIEEVAEKQIENTVEDQIIDNEEEMVSQIDPELELLFEESEVKELSDKLSLRPLTDLSKGMGINDKIFTIQELFGGDQNAFDAILKDLNKLDDFQLAKKLLIGGVASKYQWANPGKKKKAKNFIRFVRRKFI